MQHTLKSFALNDVKLSDVDGGMIDAVVTSGTWRRVALKLCRIGNTVVRGRAVDFLCEVSGGRNGVRKYGYYRCGIVGGKLTAALVAKPYNEVYHPQRTIDEYESDLHFNSIVRLWRFKDTPTQ